MDFPVSTACATAPANRIHNRRFCVNTSSTFMPSAAPIRAKLNTINPIDARSRKPAGVVISMLSMSVRASSGASTGLLPAFTTWDGPRTDPARFVGITWPVTIPLNAARRSLAVGAACSRVCYSIQAET